jgi:hypothetical protein
MEFEGQYLTYEEYRGLGGTVDLMPFNLLEFESRKKIDEKTFNRLKNSEDIPQEVKLCVYNLINSISSISNSTSNVTNTSNIASENIDGYSINYVTPDKISSIIKSKNDEINDIIETYLFGIIYNGEHLLYTGV